ncbi:MAG: UTP--glucose-1-phosphate uridylyltransferase [Oscillospiraceae bacterium]|nr:UTP--glucose-1-phosphate uridylyltransferase [Oscillospiraceae bacterium]MCL2159209.1 UTP--glucose-1-phosphate uridylyltransferase [Oscillospiraceae bacterium]
MAKKITKAVILAAGLGTRMLPIAKSVPKEMLPIVDKPAMQYNVTEAVASGITDILIITNRGKEMIENYFDYSPEYESLLEKKGDEKSLENLKAIRKIPNLANIHYIRQKEPKGLGHAVLCAKSFVGDDDFVVIYGDDIIIGEKPATGELIEVYEKFGGDICVAAVKEVEREKLQSYCSLDVVPSADNSEFYVYDMIEKPKTDAEIFSNYAILGRVLLTPEIFGFLKTQTPGAGNEIQLTDSMKRLVTSVGKEKPAKMIAKVFSGERHDMGSKLGFLRANVIEGAKHPEFGEDFKKFLKEFVK